ncbi:uncharacterized protein LOC135386982 [Ornithodoros turicata]|uniref:uncharacterized protein LOC135386982 n=1 Tax=Ornithodoros turicata TaxID=34597 RepID=UPI003138E9E7
MQGIVWEQLDAATMSRFSVELLREELEARKLDSAGPKDELVQRLMTNINAQREASPPLEQTSSTSTGAPAVQLDPATLQNLSALLQHMPRPTTTLTTLPDLSSSIPQFEDSRKQNVKMWLEDVRRVQQLACWEDATTRLIAASKLKGAARNWHLAFGSQFDTWTTWSAALQETFSPDLTLIEWQNQVMKVTQEHGQSLYQYAFAKLRVIECCPVTLSDAQKIDYLLQGIREQHISAALAANRPQTVKGFITTCCSLDKCAYQQNNASPSSSTSAQQKPATQSPRTTKPSEPSIQAPVQLQHAASGVIVTAAQKLAPQMANAVILTHSNFAAQVQVASPDCLQKDPLPSPDQPLWRTLAQEAPPLPSHNANATPSAGTLLLPLHPDLPAAHIGDQLSTSQQSTITDILAQHMEVFARHEDDLGHFAGTQHRIDLLPNALPYSRSPYRYTTEDRQFIENQIKKLLNQGIILPASGPWAFPVVVVSRGDKKRLCVNYAPLNERTISVVHPLPIIEDIIQDVANCAYFATMDLKCAYWQVSLRPQDYEKTAFITHHGTYMWTRMPFGLKNAPSTF